MSLDFDVEIIVKVNGRRQGITYREVRLDATVKLNGAFEQEHFDVATAEAAVRALEDSGPTARRITGQLPFMSEVQFRSASIAHSLQGEHGTN